MVGDQTTIVLTSDMSWMPGNSDGLLTLRPQNDPVCLLTNKLYDYVCWCKYPDLVIRDNIHVMANDVSWPGVEPVDTQSLPPPLATSGPVSTEAVMSTGVTAASSSGSFVFVDSSGKERTLTSYDGVPRCQFPFQDSRFWIQGSNGDTWQPNFLKNEALVKAINDHRQAKYSSGQLKGDCLRMEFLNLVEGSRIMDSTPPDGKWLNDWRNVYPKPDRDFDLFTLRWCNLTSHKKTRAKRFRNDSDLNRSTQMGIAKIMGPHLEAKLLLDSLYYEATAGGPNLLETDASPLETPVPREACGMSWEVEREDGAGMFLFLLNTFEDRSILKKVHPKLPEELMSTSATLAQIKDNLVTGRGGIFAHGGELKTALSFIHWPKFGSTVGPGAGLENQLGSKSKSVFLADTKGAPLWSSKWGDLPCHTYATSSVLYHDDDYDARPDFLARVDSFNHSQRDADWHSPLCDPGTVLEAAELLDQIKRPVFEPVSLEVALAEHKTMVHCYNQVDNMNWRLRVESTPPEAGHVRVYVLCQIWETVGNVSRWTDTPQNLLSKLKGHKSGKEGSNEIAVPIDNCIPVAIMVTYNEPVHMGNQGYETILALTRESKRTIEAAIAESVNRRRTSDQFEAPQLPIFPREPVSRPVRLNKWVDVGHHGKAAAMLEY